MSFWDLKFRLTFWDDVDLTAEPDSMVFALPGGETDYVDPCRDFDELVFKLLNAPEWPLTTSIRQRFEFQPRFRHSRDYHNWRANVSLYYISHQINFLQPLPTEPWVTPPPDAYQHFVVWSVRWFDSQGQLCHV